MTVTFDHENLISLFSSCGAFSHYPFYVLERQGPPCSADELDISQCLLKALESDSDSPPWPSLHVNMDNKVRHISYS